MLLVKLIGMLAVLVLVGAVAMVVTGSTGNNQFNPASLDPARTGGFSGPVMAMEFVETPAQVAVILDQNRGANRKAVANQILIDFIWIVCYVLLYVALSLLLAEREFAGARYLAVCAAICGIAAGGFDVMENIGILRVVDTPGIGQAVLNDLHIRSFAIWKWSLTFVTLSLLGFAFYGRGALPNIIAILFHLTALVGFIALLYKPLLAIVALPLLLGLLLLIWQCFSRPQQLYID